jgi:predicted P-loop ATPase
VPPPKTLLEKRIAAATAYISEGYKLFRLNGKLPASKKWNSVSRKSESADNLGASYGIPLREDDLLIDADPRRYKDGQNDLTAFLALLNIGLGKTYVVRTGGEPHYDVDGCHVYFKKPADLKIKRKVPGFAGLEIKSVGQYVVGAYSIHPETGNTYEPIQGWIGEVEQAPQALLDYLSTEDMTVEQGTGFDDSPTNRRRYTAFLVACEPAIEGMGGDNKTYTVACEGRDYGLSEAVCFRLMADYFNPRCQPEWDEDVLQEKVSHAYSYGQNAVGSKNVDDFDGEPIDAAFINNQIRWDLKPGKLGEEYVPTLRNLLNFFKLVPDTTNPNPLFRLVRFNEFAHTIEFIKPAPWHLSNTAKWTDSDTDGLLAYLSTFKKFNCSSEMAIRAVNVYARQFPCHPVKSYLSTIKWDRVPRLDMMLTDYAGVVYSPYVREVSKNTMIGAVARIYEPGCQFDTMTVLEGDQGNGKTNFVRVLGGEWYADVPLDPHNKDTIQKMLGHWILEASEMEFINRAEVNAIKSFLTIKIDVLRFPYGRLAEDVPRTSIFIGTVNPNATGAYLTDATGNRRFLPVRCNRIKLKGLAENRDQLWAEAYVRYKKGEDYYIKDPVALKMAIAEQKQREHTDAWTEIVSAWLKSPDAPREFETKEVGLNALNLSAKQFGRIEQLRITTIMKGLGYTQVRKRVRGIQGYFWAHELTEDL